MEIFAQGSDVILDIFMYNREGGDLVDPDNYPGSEPRITVKDQNGLVKIADELISQPYFEGTGRISVGHYSYKYRLADDAPLGTQWRYIWSLTINSVVLPEIERTEYFEVVEAGYISFAGYITISEVRAYMEGMGIDSSVLSDGFIQKQIQAGIAKAQRLTGGKSFFTIKEETIQKSGDGSKTVQLPNWPVEEILSVALKYTGIEDTILRESDYILNKKTGQISLLSTILSTGQVISTFPVSDNNIEIKYRHGYADVPDDIKDAIIKMIMGSCLRQISARTGGVTSLSIEGYSKSYGDGMYQKFISGLHAEASSILKSYRSIV